MWWFVIEGESECCSDFSYHGYYFEVYESIMCEPCFSSAAFTENPGFIEFKVFSNRSFGYLYLSIFPLLGARCFFMLSVIFLWGISLEICFSWSQNCGFKEIRIILDMEQIYLWSDCSQLWMFSFEETLDWRLCISFKGGVGSAMHFCM